MQRYRPLLAMGLLLCGPAVLAGDSSTERKHPLDGHPKCMDRDGASCVINDGPRKRVVIPAQGGASAKAGSAASGTDDGSRTDAGAAPATTLLKSK